MENKFPIEYDKHPQCKIKVYRSGRIEFIPVSKQDVVPKFEDMQMPGRDFWKEISGLIAALDDEATRLKGKLAAEQAVNMELTKGDSSRRKYVSVGTNKKQAFFAGIQFQKQQQL